MCVFVCVTVRECVSCTIPQAHTNESREEIQSTLCFALKGPASLPPILQHCRLTVPDDRVKTEKEVVVFVEPLINCSFLAFKSPRMSICSFLNLYNCISERVNVLI